MLGWLKALVGRVVRGGYSAAKQDEQSQRWWADADSLSARAALDPSTRQTIRERSRHEFANNTWLYGIVWTLANYLIGTGPKLQVMTADRQFNRAVERAFGEWARAIHFARKLRTGTVSKKVDGEIFFVHTTNPLLPTSVKLDLRDVEADQVETPFLALRPGDLSVGNGVVFDEYGNPTAYHVLKHHPGDWLAYRPDYSTVPARLVNHWFRRSRPGQVRGVSEVAPALGVFNEIRRYSQAVLGAAETVAAYTLFIKTTSPSVDPDASVGGTSMPIKMRQMSALPDGYDVFQPKAEQPTTQYGDYVTRKLNEACRCLNIPLILAMGNSSDANYSSGRLDHQDFVRSLKVERADLEAAVVDPAFAAWLEEAVMIEGLLPPFPAGVSMAAVPHRWIWQGQEHVDPLKEAQAQQTRLQNGTTTFAREYGELGLDWEEQLEQSAAEQRKLAELGLSFSAAAASLSQRRQQPAQPTDQEAADAQAQAA